MIRAATTQEVAPIQPVPGTAVDHPTRFGSGQGIVGGGRPKGARSKLSRRMAEELEHHFDETGPASNPLIILATIASDPLEKSMIRVQAASALCRVLIPRKLELSNENPDVKIHADKMILMLSDLFTPKALDAATT
jgi:hypothetical protein